MRRVVGLLVLDLSCSHLTLCFMPPSFRLSLPVGSGLAELPCFHRCRDKVKDQVADNLFNKGLYVKSFTGEYENLRI